MNLSLSNKVSKRLTIIAACSVVFFLEATLSLEAQQTRPDKRVKPPQFSEAEQAIFPKNALSELVGERPARIDPTQIANSQKAPSDHSQKSRGNWSDWVETDVLETEIKRQHRRLSSSLQSSARFKSGAYRVADDAMGIISLMFAVTDQHTESPRWQEIATRLRDAYATGEESIEADTGSFERASQRSEDLTDLIRGGRPSFEAAKNTVDWSRYATRGAIMRRMKVAHEDNLSTWAKDRRELLDNAEDALHESQILSLLAEALIQPEAYDGSDKDYQAHSRELRDAANQIKIAVEQEDQPAAARAFKRAQQSCVNCHADYRG